MRLRPQIISAIFWRNFSSYFSGVLGYLFIVVFVVAGGAFTFNARFFTANEPSLDQLTQYFPLLLFFVPARMPGTTRAEATCQFNQYAETASENAVTADENRQKISGEETSTETSDEATEKEVDRSSQPEADSVEQSRSRKTTSSEDSQPVNTEGSPAPNTPALTTRTPAQE